MQKRLNVRIEQLTKLVETLTEWLLTWNFGQSPKTRPLQGSLEQADEAGSIQEERQKYPVVNYGVRLYPLRVRGGAR